MKERINKIYQRIATVQLDGISIIEIILILVIIIGLIVIFRTQITEIITSAFNSIMDNSSEINTDISISE